MFNLNKQQFTGRVTSISELKTGTRKDNKQFSKLTVSLAISDNRGHNAGFFSFEIFNDAAYNFMNGLNVGLRLYVETELSVNVKDSKTFYNFRLVRWQYLDTKETNNRIREQRHARGLQPAYVEKSEQGQQQAPAAPGFAQAPNQNQGFTQPANQGFAQPANQGFAQPAQNQGFAPQANQGFAQPAQQQFGQAQAQDFSHPAYSQEPKAGFGAMPQDGNFGFPG